MTHDRKGTPIQMVQLTDSHRFGHELASLLTRYQYHRDGITLTAAEQRPLPSSAYTAPTAGLEAVFSSSASVVFVCYEDRENQMVNPIEATLTEAIGNAVCRDGIQPDGETATTSGEQATDGGTPDPGVDGFQGSEDQQRALSFGVVTPHNAQRGALETRFDETVTANTVEKYQGGERDVIAVSATVSDPEFARREERFILNPNRLLVAISRSRLLTVVVCSTSLFEVAPKETHGENGPIWARLFTQAVGRDPRPTWDGNIAEFVGRDTHTVAGVPVRVYPSSV